MTIEIEREVDGRYIAEIRELPGVMAYGQNPQEAVANAEALALRVLAERVESGDEVPELSELFKVAA